MILPELGVGVVYWPCLEPLLKPGLGLVQVLEIEPQPFWLASPTAGYRIDEDAFELIASAPQPKLVHSVGCPVGGIQAAEPTAVARLQESVERVGAAWVSEHLSFNMFHDGSARSNAGFLLPPRQTCEGALVASQGIRRLAANFGVPFAFETGVNYLRPRSDELSDGEFAAMVADEADCSILLDLHNLYANERNGRQRVDAFLEALPLERVIEVHLAGGFEYQGFWVDAHSGKIPDALLGIARDVIPALPNLKAIIFEIMPAFVAQIGLDAVRAQLECIGDLWGMRCTRQVDARPILARLENSSRVAPSPAAWEATLGSLVAGGMSSVSCEWNLADDPGVAVLGQMASEVRAGNVVEALPLTTRLLMLRIGAESYRSLLTEFWRTAPPAQFAGVEAEAFASFLAVRSLPVAQLDDVLEFERAILRTFIDGTREEVRFGCDPAQLLGALARGELPRTLTQGAYSVAIQSGTLLSARASI